MDNKQYKRIAVEPKVATQMQEIARKKGVSLGVYLEALMNYVIEKKIDYTDKDSEDIKKNVDRVIKILRVYEREYFIPTYNHMKTFVDGVELEDQSSSEHGLEETNLNSQEVVVDQNRERELERQLNRQTLAIRQCEWLINKAVQVKGKVVIEVSLSEFDDCQKSLNNVL